MTCMYGNNITQNFITISSSKNEIKNYLLTFTSPTLIQTLKSIRFMILCSIQIQLSNKYSTCYISTTPTIYNHLHNLLLMWHLILRILLIYYFKSSLFIWIFNAHLIIKYSPLTRYSTSPSFTISYHHCCHFRIKSPHDHVKS
jgi:hypothetical protein